MLYTYWINKTYIYIYSTQPGSGEYVTDKCTDDNDTVIVKCSKLADKVGSFILPCISGNAGLKGVDTSYQVYKSLDTSDIVALKLMKLIFLKKYYL